MRKHKPVRLRCTKAPKCKRGRWIDLDDLMPPGTVVCVQPCDRHEENGYYDLQIEYLDAEGKELSQNPDDWTCAKCGKPMQFKDGMCMKCFGGDPGQ